MINREKLALKDVRVLCIGRILLDIVAYPIDNFPNEEYAEEIKSAELTYGGSAANTAVEFSRLGITTYIAGVFGKDAMSYRIRDILQAQGIDTTATKFDSVLTSSFCFVPVCSNRQPRYLYYSGADSRLSFDNLISDLSIVEFIRNEYISHVHIAGINLLPSLDGDKFSQLLKILKSDLPHVSISVDTSKVLTNSRVNLPAFKYIDMFLCNEREAWSIAKSPELSDISNCITQNKGNGAKRCVVKLGDRGAALCMPQQKPTILPAYKVEVKNLNGAGDAFAAKLISYLLLNCDFVGDCSEQIFKEAVINANKYAAEFVATSMGSNRRKSLRKNAKLRHWSSSLHIVGDDKTVFLSDSYIESFKRYRSINPSVMLKWTSEIYKLLSEQDAERYKVLDVGCGIGRFTFPFSQQIDIDNLEITALDKSIKMVDAAIKRAKNEAIDNIKFINKPFESFFPNSKFHLIFMSEVIHLIDNLKKFFSHAKEYLYPGGYLVIRTSNHMQLKEHEMHMYFPDLLEFTLRKHRDFDVIYKILSQCGFSKMEITEINESQQWSRKEYIDSLKNRCFSTLYYIDNDSFNEGIRYVTKITRGKKEVTRTMKMSLISVMNSST